MNPTSLLTNVLNLVARDGEARVKREPEGPRFELPELPEAATRGTSRQDLGRNVDRDTIDRERLERDDEPAPRPELVTQSGPSEPSLEEELAARAMRADVEADYDPNGRPGSPRGLSFRSVEDSASQKQAESDASPDAAGPTRPGTYAAHSSAAQGPAGQPGEAQAAGAQGPQELDQNPRGQQGQAPTAQAQVQITPTATVAQSAPQVMAQAAQLALAQQDGELSPESGGLEGKAPGAEGAGPKGLDTSVETGLDGLGLKLSERVLGVGSSSHLSPSAPQTRADLSHDVADAVQRLLADAADESSVLRFRTESGQTFLAQARIEPGQPMELRLLADDPGVRAMLAERLNDLRSALHRVGFGDAAVQVDRDPSSHGDASQHGERPERDEPAMGESAPTVRRPVYAQPEPTPRVSGRLHLIL